MKWTDEDDLILAEFALRSLREAGSEDDGILSASLRLGVSAEECFDRWTYSIMHKYQAAIQIALSRFKSNGSSQKVKPVSKDWEFYKKKYVKDAIRIAEELIKRADEHESPIEKITALYLFYLYQIFQVGIIKIHPQMIIGKYTADFVVTYEIANNEEIAIVIECDGHEFHQKTKEQVSRDKERDRYMTKEGYKILRYSGSEICEDPMRIVIDVKDIINNVRG